MSNVESIQPEEDIGADTAARYRYQAELVARVCMAIIDGTIERVICEWHEDYVVIRVGLIPELVSVKHVEPSQPRWTVRELFQEGGIAHIFRRWRALRENASCLIQTNSGLRTGAGNAAELHECCKDKHHAKRPDWIQTCIDELAVAGVEPVPVADEMRRFLDVLRFEDDLPSKPHIRATNVMGLARPITETLGRSVGDADDIYDSVVAVAESASRNDGGPELLALIADPTRFDPESQLAAMLAAKTIDRPRLLRALQPNEPAPVVTLMGDDGSLTRMVLKMERGGFGPTAISNARNLRLNWEGHRRRWLADLGERSSEFSAVEAIVLDVADNAEQRARESYPGEPYGPRMLRLVKEAFEQAPISVPAAGTDLRLVLGCVWNLTELCLVWWSDRFDVDEALA